MQNVYQFLGRHRISLMMRTFSADPTGAERRADMVMEMISKALALKVGSSSIFSRVEVLIPCDDRYPSDCGQTAPAIRERVKVADLSSKVFVTRLEEGDLFCASLNYGIAKQLAHGMHYTLIISPEVHSYMNFETMVAVLEKAAQGSWATGVAINELTESILAGRLANTFCLWHNQRLGQVGNFDLLAEKPIDEQSAHYKRGWDDENKKFVYYQMAGVEEIIPLCRMIKTNREKPCIAAVLPQGKEVKLYQPPPPGPELDRHIAKMATKTVRQAYLAAQAGFDLDYLRGGLMN